jgi:type I restriction enzyme R subunit
MGRDREAAVRLFADFLTGKQATANQIEFVNLIIDHLTEYEVIEPSRLYELPLVDLNSHCPEGLFSPSQVQSLVEPLKSILDKTAG